MTKRLNATVALAASAGCSFEIKQLQRPYDKRTQPRCEPDDAAAGGDVIVGGLLALGGVALAAIPASEPDPDPFLFDPPERYTWTNERVFAGIGVAAIGAIWGGIGLAGMKWNRDCVEAREQWDMRQIEQDEHLRSKAVVRVHSDPVPTAPRGFFCTSSPSNEKVGTCARERSDCDAARSSLVVAAPDVGECALTESAWCYRNGQRCSPSGATCTAQHDAEIAANPDSVLGPCVVAK